MPKTFNLGIPLLSRCHCSWQVRKLFVLAVYLIMWKNNPKDIQWSAKWFSSLRSNKASNGLPSRFSTEVLPSSTGLLESRSHNGFVLSARLLENLYRLLARLSRFHYACAKPTVVKPWDQPLESVNRAIYYTSVNIFLLMCTSLCTNAGIDLITTSVTCNPNQWYDCLQNLYKINTSWL